MRSAFAVIIFTVCLLGTWFAGRAGYARFLARHAVAASQLENADRAVRLASSDPETRTAQADVFMRQGEAAKAIVEYERAVALRPRDYALWLTLGYMREITGDAGGALANYTEAVRLAPYYAQPRWLLGNSLLRQGRRDEAFVELKRAAESNPTFLPAVINLAWRATGGDARAVEHIVRPQTAAARLALGRFFIERGRVSEALNLLRSAGDAAETERRALLTRLLADERFAEAYEVWASARDAGREPRGVAAISDGGFENRIVADAQGFEWQPARNAKLVQTALDAKEPHSGSYSLRIEYSGNDKAAERIISQLVLVEPKTNYRLRFAARTQEVVSGGLPVVSIIDARKRGQTLAVSGTLPQGTSGWQDYAVDFSTEDATRAVSVVVQRQKCESGRCPIFGRIWLDGFSLQKRL